ncbi:MAG: hypothetical protein LBQ66_15370 [Planctomycetaceae bacterium]|jgi:hypothetical protein|nr:hypothetical protein [Planctomycetaceae bacterium]
MIKKVIFWTIITAVTVIFIVRVVLPVSIAILMTYAIGNYAKIDVSDPQKCQELLSTIGIRNAQGIILEQACVEEAFMDSHIIVKFYARHGDIERMFEQFDMVWSDTERYLVNSRGGNQKWFCPDDIKKFRSGCHSGKLYILYDNSDADDTINVSGGTLPLSRIVTVYLLYVS